MRDRIQRWSRTPISRRAALQAGTLGLLGLSIPRLAELRAANATPPRAKACIYIFLSGGLSQLDSFDMKPEAPDAIRGEFQPIATRTPGLQICEHLPRLAARSEQWALCRSLTHTSNDHSAGHLIMLTGRSEVPPGFDPTRPLPTDWPSLAAIAGDALPARGPLPSSIVLPERLVHTTGRVIPGQFAGQMGPSRDPWFIEASPFHTQSYGAFPEFAFDHQERGAPDARTFQSPHLSPPPGINLERLSGRFGLLTQLDEQCQHIDRTAATGAYDRQREAAASLLTAPEVRQAFDVTQADDATQDRYGRHSFGWSLLMARRLVEAGVSLVQVNLGNNETWDTHGDAFPHLKNKLLPPTDQALSALLDDLAASGLLDSTLVVMAGEFGRTPKISHLSQFYKYAGRDHWGAVQTVFFAGGGVQGGHVLGASDRQAAFPADAPQSPESLAATIYHALGIPRDALWHDKLGRPFSVYHGEPMRELF
jgi:uncharacterized protein (DUF1501 family)